MLNIVLYAPEIPANTGNIGRTCVLTGTSLHLIEPIGFSLDERSLHRAGLGYWQNLDLAVHPSWDAFVERCGLAPAGDEPRLHLLTKKARRIHTQATYRDGDYLVLGSESSGIPEELLARYAARCERIPMLPDAASLENRDAWAQAEAARTAARDGVASGYAEGHGPLRAQDICGNFIDPEDYRISALNLSNAAAVVLYEALRQTGFPGMER
ncbi:tRNA (cytidine(34)-2'-O)-methyltransferase [Enorma burkinafasonensis]|uniref:tRNA (cytidine(34)-2'-O)-methyltransferase n=1 Tax=Enorma burkinafasonensis TaxID=2590867 RepID=UPI00119E16E6|nr:tRNA (cytidine(34)-2'-O)-methyltransferase [Enorma burkinafasonensis]